MSAADFVNVVLYAAIFAVKVVTISAITVTIVLLVDFLRAHR